MNKRLILIISFAMLLSACVTTNADSQVHSPDIMESGELQSQDVISDLPDLGLAPELTNQVWLNSDPITLKDLQGKVVLLEMWTFG